MTLATIGGFASPPALAVDAQHQNHRPDPGTTARATPQTDPGQPALSLQGGWWNLEAEWKTSSGVFVAAGIPWVVVPLALANGATWVVPVGARVGYQHNLSFHWSLRGSAHAAFVVDDEHSKCGCEAPGTTTRTFAFAEVGVRYDSRRGFVGGVDVPVIGARLPQHIFAPPESLAFGQIYLGYAWGM